MKEYGGGFVSALGAALERADDQNRALIRSTWPAYWAKYEAIGKMLAERSAAREAQP